MSNEFSLPPQPTSKFSTRLLSDLYLFFSLVLSHPLYLLYFIFFSPYILKIFSFLSPLFITTFLLLLALFTTLLHENSAPTTHSPAHTFLVNLFDKLKRHNDEEEHQHLEELQAAYKIVFEESTLELLLEQQLLSEPFVDKYPSHECSVYDRVYESSVSDKGQVSINHVYESSVSDQGQVSINRFYESSVSEKGQVSINQVYESSVSDKGFVTDNHVNESSVSDIEQVSGNHVKESSVSDEGLVTSDDVNESSVCDQGLVTSNHVNESLAEVMLKEQGNYNDEEKEVKAGSAESNKGEEDSIMKRRSKEIPTKSLSEVKESKVRSKSQRLGSSDYYENRAEYSPSDHSLGSFGSMRREKEWKRTLACKLFEERHNVNVDGGVEGMDLLWETYETDNNNSKSNKVVSKSKSKKGKRDVINYNDDYNEEEDDDEEIDDNGQLCCLQALKFSAGKMNLGMGRPNLVKFSKAIKGFGWLHHVTKHGHKKVYP